MNQIKKLTLFIVIVNLFLFTNKAISQDIIDEDFLEKIEENSKSQWDENIKAFDINVEPEVYKNESAVIIGWKRNVNFDKKSNFRLLGNSQKNLIFVETIRFKIKLNDKNAVNEFSEIYFRYSDSKDGFSARIIKPDGTNNLVSLSSAVGIENSQNVPEFYKSFFDTEYSSNQRYFKVAVSDLEIGDVLEYVTLTKSTLNVTYDGYVEFSPQYEICNKAYPILFNQISIETDDKSYFKALSKNGAPDFKLEESTEKGLFRYVFTDVNRSVEKDINFVNILQVYPMVKFQVIYSIKDNFKGLLIGEKGKLKSSFTKEELAKKAYEDFENSGSIYLTQFYTINDYVDEFWRELKKQGAKDWSESEFINNVFYRIRNFVMNRDSYLSDKVACFFFKKLLQKKDIQSDLIISVSNKTTQLEEILFESEIKYIVKVNNDYFCNVTDHSMLNEIPDNLLGNQAYIIEAPQKNKEQIIKTILLPNATYLQNKSVFKISSELLKDMSTLAVKETTISSGQNKIRNLITDLRYTPYMIDDYVNYGGESPVDKMKTSEKDEYAKSVTDLKEQYAKLKKEQVLDDLQGEYSQQVKYKGFAVTSSGRTNKQKELIITKEFELLGMIKKAGKKLLVNIPGLVGSQLQITKDELDRKVDIDVNYERALTWNIEFKIPDGYTVDGLKELTKNIYNEIGTFDCIAEEKNGSINIVINKIYKRANIPKAKWLQMVAFVEAAFNSSFKYILLKQKV